MRCATRELVITLATKLASDNNDCDMGKLRLNKIVPNLMDISTLAIRICPPRMDFDG